MNRDDAEDLALGYCLRNVKTLEVELKTGRPAAERAVVVEAVKHYGSGLTAAALRRIKKKLRDSRPPKGLQAMLTLKR